MAITKRTLERWRREALQINKRLSDPNFALSDDEVRAMTDRILRLTQILSDQYLLRRDI